MRLQRKAGVVFRITVSFVVLSLPLGAHHSFDAQYDRNKPLQIQGMVSKLEWVNPHVWVHLDVKDGEGKVSTWACEFGSPNLVIRHGLSREALTAGASLTVNGAAAKDGSRTINAITVRVGNDPTIFQASSAAQPNP